MGSLETSWEVATKSTRATQNIGRRIGLLLSPNSVVGLVGDLGAGKTVFTKGLAQGLGVLDLNLVVSPTYALVHEYQGKDFPLVHIDFYRLDEEDLAYSLGIEEQIYRQDAIIAVEWADKIASILPQHTIWVKISFCKSDVRQIEVTGLPKLKGIRT